MGGPSFDNRKMRSHVAGVVCDGKAHECGLRSSIHGVLPEAPRVRFADPVTYPVSSGYSFSNEHCIAVVFADGLPGPHRHADSYV